MWRQEDIDYHQALQLDAMRIRAQNFENARAEAERLEIAADQRDDARRREFWHEVSVRPEERAHEAQQELRQRESEFGFAL